MDNAVNSKNPTSKVCQVCGVAGYSKLLVTCCRCARASQHIYCMPVVHLQIPDSWLCEECLVGTPVAPNGKHHNPYDGHKSVKLCLPSADGEEQGHRTLSSLCPSDAATKNVNTVNDGKGMAKDFHSDKHIMQSSSRYSYLKSVENEKPKFIPSEEVTLARSKMCKGQRSLHKHSHTNDLAEVTSHISRRLVGSELTLLGSKVTTGQCHNAEVDASLMKFNKPSELVTNDKDTSTKIMKALGPSSCYVGPNVHSFDAPHPDTGDVSRKKVGKVLQLSRKNLIKSKGCNLHEMSISRKFLINTVENALNSCLALGACWKGTFEVSGVFSQTNIEMQAYYPGEMIAKSYDILKNIPTILNLKIVPRMDAWPKLFQLVTPSFEDVGLIFMPAECERSKEKYTCLLTWIDKHDSAIQSSIGNVELLIYSSTRLTENSQRIDKQTYLWGVLKHTKKRKHHMHNLEKPSQVATGIKDNNYPAQFSDAFEARNEVDMEVDMIGGVEVGRIDIPLPNPDGPPGFQRQIRSDAGHEYIP